MRAILPTLTLVALVLAGCADQEAPTQTTAPTVILVTDQNDVASLANDSFMMAAHQHDYWGGKDRLTVLDVTLPAGECCLMTLGNGGLDLVFVPADGAVVPHGTSKVEVTVTLSDGTLAHYGEPELLLQTAADHEPASVGAIAPGTPIVFETNDAQLDLPHQSLSAWRFVVRLHPGPATLLTQWEGEVHVVAEAVRGREIPVYPPHPDLWEGKDALELFAEDAPPALWNGVIDETERGYGCIRGCWPKIHRPENGTVVPFDATTIEVVLDAHPDAPFEMGLKFHGADSRNFTDLVPTSVDGTTRTYEIPIELGTGDSPYAVQSVWGFAIYSEKPERDGWFSGWYSISARALRTP